MDEKKKSLLMEKAAALLAHRAYSRGEMRKKLAASVNVPGDNDTEIESTLDRLEELRLLNDADYAYNFALYRMKESGWGAAKIDAALLRNDVAKQVIAGAIARVLEETNEADFTLTAVIKKYCEKKGTPADAGAARRLALYLARRGFDEEQIFHAIEQVVPPEIFRKLTTD